MVLPLVKLWTLVVKTLSKPIASRLKQQAKLHRRFRQLIIDLAQANHPMTTIIQRRIYVHATDVEIRPLNEVKAVQAAVDLIGKVFVFTLSHRQVAGVVVVIEVQRSAKSEGKKEEKRRQEMEGIKLANWPSDIEGCPSIHFFEGCSSDIF